jgi:hypothetical protein
MASLHSYYCRVNNLKDEQINRHEQKPLCSLPLLCASKRGHQNYCGDSPAKLNFAPRVLKYCGA